MAELRRCAWSPDCCSIPPEGQRYCTRHSPEGAPHGVREQSALELLETHAKALEAENERLRGDLAICRQLNASEYGKACAENERLTRERDRLHKQLLEHAEVCGESAYPISDRVAVETFCKHQWTASQEVFVARVCDLCGETEYYEMRVAGPEASGEATGPEGDDSNMGTAPTSGPEATSSQGNAERTTPPRLYEHENYCNEHGGHLRDSPACYLARERETDDDGCSACGHATRYHFDDGAGNVVCRASSDCECCHRAESIPAVKTTGEHG